jgi:thioredoxin 1
MKIEVLKFYADWCGPCKVLSQRLEEEKNITEINVDTDHETAIKYRIRNIPVLVFLKDGEEVHRTTGLITKYEYDLIINEIKTDKDIDTAKAASIEVVAEFVNNIKQNGDGDND